MKIYGKTDVGSVRNANQDRFVCETLSDNSAIICVCDGMGGEKGGEVASEYAIETFVHHIKTDIFDNIDQNQVSSMLRRAVEYANNYVYQIGLTDEALSKMGTTLVGGVVISNTFYVANIGDSRCYHIGSQGITQVTKDHSVVQEIMENTDISHLETHLEPLKKYLTRAIGHSTGDDCDIYKVNLVENDIILLCSDGLHNLVIDKHIEEIVASDLTIESKCDLLIQTANTNGGNDNITVAMLVH